MKTSSAVMILMACIFGFIFLIGGGMVVFPHYNVWQQGLAGKAKLVRADQERQILVSKARAEFEASELQAKSIEIVGKVAKKYPEYRYQEFMSAFADALNNEDSPIKLILVPTEANMPIILNDVLKD